jgi:GNAT superfamily N-acetyltransferase
MELQFVFTDENDENFILLDNEQSVYYLKLLGNISIEYMSLPVNKKDYFVVIVLNKCKPIACGAFKEYSHKTIELKRIFVKEKYQKQGIGKILLKKLEYKAKERGYEFAILETNINMPIAIGFYSELNYNLIENFPPYTGNSACICMRKKLL